MDALNDTLSVNQPSIKSSESLANPAKINPETLIAIACILVGYSIYLWQKYSFWSKRNVKNPTPLPIFGNLLGIAFEPREKIELNNIKTFGKIYGYYQGTKPCLVVGDASVLRQISVKDFNLFPNRMLVPRLNKYQKHFLFFLQDDHWRGVRNIVSPTFASGKIKAMFKGMSDCTQDLVDSIIESIDNEKSGTVILEPKSLIGSFSMSITLRSFYSVKLNKSTKDPLDDNTETNEGFTEVSNQIFRPNFFRIVLSYVLPNFIQNLIDFSLVGTTSLDFFFNRARAIIAHRRKMGSNSPYVDLLQLLLDARSDSKVENSETDKFEEHHVIDQEISTMSSKASNSGVKKDLSEMEVYAQTMLFINVATQTTKELISNTIFLLAHHPEIQDKLLDALIAIGEPSDSPNCKFNFTYEKVTSCEYLDCVISESLRHMPQVLEMDRLSVEDYHIGEPYNINIPKGTVVKLAYYSIHKDPVYWPEPEKFNPDRFKPENKKNIVPGSYSPFGQGPRFCVGYRFALTEAKVALARLVTEFKFEPAPGVQFPAKLKKYSLVLSNYDDVRVLYRRR